MGQESNIVVWDPRPEAEGGYGQGSLVDDDREVRVLRALGAAVLPVDSSLFELSGVGGFAFRRWGTGWPIGASPSRLSPMTLFCPGRFGRIHWVGRFAPDAPALAHLERGGHLEGEVRLQGDTSQHNQFSPPLAADDSKVLASELRFSGLNMGTPTQGHAPGALAGGAIRITPSGGLHGIHYPFCLWGRMPGVRLEWLALSWSER